jgi:hypothetical protein
VIDWAIFNDIFIVQIFTVRSGLSKSAQLLVILFDLVSFSLRRSWLRFLILAVLATSSSIGFCFPVPRSLYLSGFSFVPSGIARGQCPVRKKRKLFKFISGQKEIAEIGHSRCGLWGCFSPDILLIKCHTLLNS